MEENIKDMEAQIKQCAEAIEPSEEHEIIVDTSPRGRPRNESQVGIMSQIGSKLKTATKKSLKAEPRIFSVAFNSTVLRKN
jgi:hypothetical protein